MKTVGLLLTLCTLLAASAAWSVESGVYKLREDFGAQPLGECALLYYYYIPCPTYSWFSSYQDWEIGDVVGGWFEVGDMSMSGFEPCDPAGCSTLKQFKVLDFAGYGIPSAYPSMVAFDVYCADEQGCPIGPSLWNSGPVDLGFGWHYIDIDPDISVCGCCIEPGDPPRAPRILITATMLGYKGYAYYPMLGFDYIGGAIGRGCDMHESGCMPALYPRPANSHYATLHSGFYGQDFEHCPPQWFKDPRDTTPDGTQYGYVELAWTISLGCYGPTAARPSTWGGIKSMYK